MGSTVNNLVLNIQNNLRFGTSIAMICFLLVNLLILKVLMRVLEQKMLLQLESYLMKFIFLITMWIL